VSRPRLLLILRVAGAAALVALAACGDDGGSPETTATDLTVTTSSAPADGTTTEAVPITDPGGASVPPLPEPNPLHLTATVHDDLAVTAEIGPEGGSLTATDPGGVTYTLTLPEGALLSPEEIVMTPLASVGGLPDGVTTWGVLLEPEGLVFLASGTLAFELPAGVDADDLFSGATFSGGEDFHLTSMSVEGATVTTPISHFTVRIAGSGVEEVLALATERVPSRAEGYVNTKEAELARIWLVPPADPLAFIDGMLDPERQWLDSIDRRLDSAVSVLDDAQIDNALAEALAMKNHLDNLIDSMGDFDVDVGPLTALRTDLLDIISAAVSRAVNHAWNKCVRDSDPDQAARLWRLAAVAEALWVVGADIAFGQIRQRALDCGTFEVRIDGTYTSHEGDHEIISAGTIRATVQPSLREFDSVTAPVRLGQFESNLTDCRTIGGSSGSIVHVKRDGTAEVRLDLDLNVRSPQPQVEQVVLRVNLTTVPVEAFRCAGQEHPPLHFWCAAFFSANTAGECPAGFVVLPIVREGEVFAARRIEGQIPSKGTATVKATSNILLVHTPRR
jgi:hypothetical protein